MKCSTLLQKLPTNQLKGTTKMNYITVKEIAEKWNKKSADSGYAGFVTTFEIDEAYISQFDIQTVGASYHQEFWIPAEDLVDFNRHIIGKIEVI